MDIQSRFCGWPLSYARLPAPHPPPAHSAHMVSGFGMRIGRLWLRVYGLGLRVEGLGLKVEGLRFRVRVES